MVFVDQYRIMPLNTASKFKNKTKQEDLQSLMFSKSLFFFFEIISVNPLKT